MREAFHHAALTWGKFFLSTHLAVGVWVVIYGVGWIAKQIALSAGAS